ncbi:MAG: DNA primase [Oscillospiraceae bacterium]|nr:DNA primase [Oscillospiraceae bacterium]
MALPRIFLDEVHVRNDIVELISSYIELKRHGRVHKALCPFHNEKTASFTVFADTQSFYCFGCNVGGDVIAFVMKQDNLEYIEAVRLLAARAGMAMPEETGDDGSRLRMRILEANKRAAQFYFDALNSEGGREARAYLRRRGMKDSTVRKFGIGYAPNEWNALRDHLLSAGFKSSELKSAGLTSEGKRGSYDAFRGRVMFPIIDVRGNIIAFGGRALGDGPKYLNTQDTGIFAKSRNLFALNFAKNTRERTIILCEGYMDVVALHQAGFPNSVATLGTSLTAAQARMLVNYADEVVLSYDTDEAGQRATRRAIDILKEVGLRVRVLNYEGAKDPDEYIRKYGSERFRLQLNESSDSIEYELAKAKLRYPTDTDAGRVRYLTEAASILARCQTPTERDLYAGRVAEDIPHVTKQALLEQVSNVSRRRQRTRERENERKLIDISSRLNVLPSNRDKFGVASAEKQLLALLFKNPDLLRIVDERIKGDDFYSKDALQVYEALRESIESDSFAGVGSLTELLSAPQMSMLAGILANNETVNFTKADADYYIQKIRAAADRPDKESLVQMAPEEINKIIAGRR